MRKTLWDASYDVLSDAGPHQLYHVMCWVMQDLMSCIIWQSDVITHELHHTMCWAMHDLMSCIIWCAERCRTSWVASYDVLSDAGFHELHTNVWSRSRFWKFRWPKTGWPFLLDWNVSIDNWIFWLSFGPLVEHSIIFMHLVPIRIFCYMLKYQENRMQLIESSAAKLLLWNCILWTCFKYFHLMELSSSDVKISPIVQVPLGGQKVCTWFLNLPSPGWFNVLLDETCYCIQWCLFHEIRNCCLCLSHVQSLLYTWISELG